MVKIKPLDKAGALSSGKLQISIDRPVMKAEVLIPRASFQELSRLLNADASRPVTVVVILNAPLSVNLAGDLLIDSAAELVIKDLSWIIPLK